VAFYPFGHITFSLTWYLSPGSCIKMLTPIRNVGSLLQVGCEELGLHKEFYLFGMCVELVNFETNTMTCGVIHLV